MFCFPWQFDQQQIMLRISINGPSNPNGFIGDNRLIHHHDHRTIFGLNGDDSLARVKAFAELCYFQAHHGHSPVISPFIKGIAGCCSLFVVR